MDRWRWRKIVMAHRETNNFERNCIEIATGGNDIRRGALMRWERCWMTRVIFWIWQLIYFAIYCFMFKELIEQRLWNLRLFCCAAQWCLAHWGTVRLFHDHWLLKAICQLKEQRYTWWIPSQPQTGMAPYASLQGK